MTGRCKGCGEMQPLLRLGEALICESCAQHGRVDGDAVGDVVLLVNGRSLRLAATAGKTSVVFAETIVRYGLLAKFVKIKAD